jgi:hypothetical protein
MSFDRLLIHRLDVKRAAATGTLDEYGQPITAPSTVASAVPGLIQPRTVRELVLASQAGAQIGTHVAFMRPLTGLANDCWFELGGVRFDIVGIADAAGRGHHLEISLQAVG